MLFDFFNPDAIAGVKVFSVRFRDLNMQTVAVQDGYLSNERFFIKFFGFLFAFCHSVDIRGQASI